MPRDPNDIPKPQNVVPDTTTTKKTSKQATPKVTSQEAKDLKDLIKTLGEKNSPETSKDITEMANKTLKMVAQSQKSESVAFRKEATKALAEFRNFVEKTEKLKDTRRDQLLKRIDDVTLDAKSASFMLLSVAKQQAKDIKDAAIKEATGQKIKIKQLEKVTLADAAAKASEIKKESKLKSKQMLEEHNTKLKQISDERKSKFDQMFADSQAKIEEQKLKLKEAKASLNAKDAERKAKFIESKEKHNLSIAEAREKLKRDKEEASTKLKIIKEELDKRHSDRKEKLAQDKVDHQANVETNKAKIKQARADAAADILQAKTDAATKIKQTKANVKLKLDQAKADNAIKIKQERTDAADHIKKVKQDLRDKYKQKNSDLKDANDKRKQEALDRNRARIQKIRDMKEDQKIKLKKIQDDAKADAVIQKLELKTKFNEIQEQAKKRKEKHERNADQLTDKIKNGIYDANPLIHAAVEIGSGIVGHLAKRMGDRKKEKQLNKLKHTQQTGRPNPSPNPNPAQPPAPNPGSNNQNNGGGGMLDGILGFLPSITSIISGIGGFFKGIFNIGKLMAGMIGGPGLAILAGAALVINGIFDFIDGFNNAGKLFGDKFTGSITEKLFAGFVNVGAMLWGLVDDIAHFFGFETTFKKSYQDIALKIFDTVSNVFNTISGAISTVFSAIGNAVKTFVGTVGTILSYIPGAGDAAKVLQAYANSGKPEAKPSGELKATASPSPVSQISVKQDSVNMLKDQVAGAKATQAANVSALVDNSVKSTQTNIITQRLDTRNNDLSHRLYGYGGSTTFGNR